MDDNDDMLEKIQEYLESTNNELVKATKLKHGILHSEITLELQSFCDVSKIEKSLVGLPFYVKCHTPILTSSPTTGSFRLLIPNDEIKTVKFNKSKARDSSKIFIGAKDDGSDLYLNLTWGSHVLLAGATGSGKSMLIHTMIQSLLSSGGTNIIFLDPKRVESQVYEGIYGVQTAHSINQINHTLKEVKTWVNNRYAVMAKTNTRDAIDAWYKSYASGRWDYEDVRPTILIIDEIADLFNDSKEAKNSILVLSSKARAAGLRIILATQRPDSKIIDGAIKANFTTRICLKTSSRVDSRIVLGVAGAEHLLGRGHGLLMPPTGELIPFQGAYVDPITMSMRSHDKPISFRLNEEKGNNRIINEDLANVAQSLTDDIPDWIDE